MRKRQLMECLVVVLASAVLLLGCGDSLSEEQIQGILRDVENLGGEEPSANTDLHILRITADSELFSSDIDIWSEWGGRLAEVSGTVIDVSPGTHTAHVTLLVGNKSVVCEMSSYPDAEVLRDMAKQRQWVTIQGVLNLFWPGKIWLDGCQFLPENPEEPPVNTNLHILRITADSELFSSDIDIWSEWGGRLAEVSGTVIDVSPGTHTAHVTLLVGNKSVVCNMWDYPDAEVLRDMAKQRQWVTIQGVLNLFWPGKIWLDGCQFLPENLEEPPVNTDMHILRITADSELFSNDIDIWSEWGGRLAEVSGTVIDVSPGTHTAHVTLLVGNKSVECEMWAYPDAEVLRDMAKQRQWVTIQGVFDLFWPGKIWLDGCQFLPENPEEDAP